MKNSVKNMCKNPVGKFARHVLTLLVSFSAANAMLKGHTNKLKYVIVLFTKQHAHTLKEFLQFLPRFSTQNAMN